MNAPYAVFAQQLRDLRRSKNLTQEQAGELVGVSGATWSRWETGQNLPAVHHLRKLAEVFPAFRGDSWSYLDQIRNAVDRDKLERRLHNATRNEDVVQEMMLGRYKIELMVDGSLRVRINSSGAAVTIKP